MVAEGTAEKKEKREKPIDISTHKFHKSPEYKDTLRRWQKRELDEALKPKKVGEEDQKEDKKKKEDW